MADPPAHDSSRGPAPGWYDDPWSTDQLRRWDGSAWTADAGPRAGAPAPPPPLAPPPGMVAAGSYHADLSVADPVRALADEQRLAGTATAGLILGAAGYVILFFSVTVLYHYLFHSVLDSIGDASRTSSSTATVGDTTEPFHLSPLLLAGSGLLQLVQFGLYAVGAIFLAWFYKAAQLARAAGLPAQRTPGLATAGYIIPIVNLWWPYQSVGDLFRPGDPRRRVVGRWWALWLCTQFGTFPLFIASFAPLVVGLLAAVAMSAVAVLAARAARQVVATVAEAHAELVDQVRPIA